MTTSGAAVHHPIFARMYARMGASFEAKGGAELRDEMLAGAVGRVIEVGAGTGLNFSHYPATVTEVVAVEPESYLRVRAERAATEAPVPVRVVDGTADALPAEDASCDVGVASLVLCSVPDQMPRWPSCAGSSARAGSCASTSTSARTVPASPAFSGPLTSSGQGSAAAATPAGGPTRSSRRLASSWNAPGDSRSDPQSPPIRCRLTSLGWC